jgi:hypothetical protein
VDLAVAEIREMQRLGSAPKICVFDLHKIPDSRTRAQDRFRPQAGKRPDLNIILNDRPVHDARAEDSDTTADPRIDDMNARIDQTPVSDARPAFDHNGRINGAVPADLDRKVNPRGGRIIDRDAVLGQLAHLPIPQHADGPGQIMPGLNLKKILG